MTKTATTPDLSRMLGQPGFLAKVFAVMGTHGVDIDMVTTSEISVSMTCAELDQLKPLLPKAFPEDRGFGLIQSAAERM